jgi:YggT family protein
VGSGAAEPVNVFDLLAYLVEAYVVVLIARALLSWLPARPGTALFRVVRVLDAVTEPVLRPLRRVLPPLRAGGMAIDLSIIIVIIVAELVVIPLLRA